MQNSLCQIRVFLYWYCFSQATMLEQQIETIVTSLCASQKLERDRAVVELNNKIKTLSPEVVQSLQRALINKSLDSSRWVRLFFLFLKSLFGMCVCVERRFFGIFVSSVLISQRLFIRVLLYFNVFILFTPGKCIYIHIFYLYIYSFVSLFIFMMTYKSLEGRSVKCYGIANESMKGWIYSSYVH